MAKLGALLLGILGPFLTSPAWAESKAGAIVPEPDSITLVGTFRGVFGPVFTSLPARGGMGTITCNGKTYVLHFSGRLITDDLSKLDGKKVVVIGKPGKGPLDPIPSKKEGFIVVVSQMPTVADDKVEEKATITINAKLDYQELESNPPQPVWSVTVHGQTYRLTFATPDLQEMARALSGEEVRVSGTVEKDGSLRVTSLMPIGR
jgi:hypothetical protein